MPFRVEDGGVPLQSHSSSLRGKSSPGIASRLSGCEKRIPRLSRITGDLVVGIMREILLRDEEFLSKLRHLILISGQGGTESVVGRTDTVSRSHKSTKTGHDV